MDDKNEAMTNSKTQINVLESFICQQLSLDQRNLFNTESLEYSVAKDASPKKLECREKKRAFLIELFNKFPAEEYNKLVNEINKKVLAQ
jgi:hypothetical protein